MDLQQLFAEQYELQQLWHDWAVMSELERDALIKELLLNLHRQVHGLQDLMDQSRYHIIKQRRDQNTYMVADSGVAVLKLLIALMLMRGVTPAMFAQAWSAVADRVRDKWRWEQDELSKSEVLLCDLDGVVTKYTEGFIAWCSARGQMIGAHINTPEMEPVKDEFHSTGGFAGLEPFPGAVDVLNRWRRSDKSNNRRLVMVTARPYRQFKQVHTDTVDWLRRHGVLYDHVFFERDKSEAVRRVHPARIVAHIEDRGKHALEVASTGVPVLKLPFAAPEEQISHPNIIHVSDWDEIDTHLIRMSNAV